VLAGGKPRELVAPPSRRSLSVDVESQEEAARLSLESPLHDYIDTEVYGLQEWDAYIKGVKHAYQQLASKR
jgi:hypothetical protein